MLDIIVIFIFIFILYFICYCSKETSLIIINLKMICPARSELVSNNLHLSYSKTNQFVEPQLNKFITLVLFLLFC